MSRVHRIAATEPVTGFRLEQNQPTPFQKRTTIRFTVAKTCEVRLAIHNREHETIRLLVNSPLLAGQYDVVWEGKAADGKFVRNGYYSYRLEANGFVATRKLELQSK